MCSSDLAMDIARDIATNVAPMSAALSKRLLWDTAINGYTPRQVASLETQLHHRVMGSDDAREGVNAFLERRRPRGRQRLPGAARSPVQREAVDGLDPDSGAVRSSARATPRLCRLVSSE